MQFFHYLDFAKNSFSHRKLRSLLTMIGIIIGIATVFSLLSIGQGFEKAINDDLESFGGNFIYVFPSQVENSNPSFGGAPENLASSQGILNKNDVSILKSVRGIDFIDAYISDRASVIFKGKSFNVEIIGSTVNLIREFPLINLEKGRIFSSSESKVIIIGNSVANNFFDKKINLGDILIIENENFRVIGIWEKGSGSVSGIFDQSITMNRRDAERIFLEPGSNEVSAIAAKISKSADIDRVTEDINNKLRISHKVIKGKEDFTIVSSKTVAEEVGKISAGINLFLGFISFISLIVGGIGIINTMFTSVIERTKQIGILKSLGATKKDIMNIFLIESSMIGFIGGFIGLIIGIIFAITLPLISPESFQFKPVINIQLIVFSLGFSVLIGTFSGLLPARRAANMNPVKSLRYE